MGCDIHIVIQRQQSGAWRDVPWQHVYNYDGATPPIAGVPITPPVFCARNYDLFAILADVRNGTGFAGIKMGEGWPSIAPHRGLPDGFTMRTHDLGDHSFTHVSLDELRAFPWDVTESWLYGVVSADDFERLSLAHAAPTSHAGGIAGPGIVVYEPDDYRALKARGALCERPYVRMGWPMTARAATYDWPGKVLPWLETLAEGCPLRLVIGFDS